MNRNFTPLARAPRIYEENVYLCDSSGKVLASRSSGDVKIRNVFELLPESEKSFLRDNLLFYGIKPLALVDSRLGPILIDCSLFGQFRSVVAIVPRFDKTDLAPLSRNELFMILKLSPRMKEVLSPYFDKDCSDGHARFCESLLSIHRGEGYYSFFGKNSAEIAVMMSDLAFAIGDFCGAELEVSVIGADDFDIANMPCMTSFSYALTTLTLLARKYSATRGAKMRLIFDEMGVFFEFGFPLASEYSKIELSREAPELVEFLCSADSRFFICHSYQDDRAFAVRGYPWVREPSSSDLKLPKPELIYYY